MKDKLYKNHHKGVYYRFRAFLFSIVAILGISGSVLLPVYINSSYTKAAHATDENLVDEDDDNNSDNNLESYNSLLAF